jgi:hypothetical protein
MNEFTTASCWKQSAVEPDAPWSIAITQLGNRPLIFKHGYREPSVCGVPTIRSR